jgi:hypothetical protein
MFLLRAARCRRVDEATLRRLVACVSDGRTDSVSEVSDVEAGHLHLLLKEASA